MQRFYETIPAALAWGTLVLMVLVSSQLPAFASIFIILFDLYWLLKSVYLSFHLRHTFGEMRRNLEINWLDRLEEIERSKSEAPRLPDGQGGLWSDTASYQLPVASYSWKDVYHLVIFPMYKEPYEVVRESFESLLQTNYPKDKFVVVLATEARAGAAAQETARKIEAEFGNVFFKFLITTHPEDLPGEIPGKGSNEAWAGERAKELIDEMIADQRSKFEVLSSTGEGSVSSAEHPASNILSYDKVLVSVFDIDTQVFPEYFGRLTYVFLTAPNNLRAVYQPVPFFMNNIYQAPALARVVAFTTTFWQMMQQSRPERLTTFSSQSVPFQTLVEIGFWQRDVVSEDSRIFWQGFLRYHGEFRVEPLFYPVSMDANVTPRFWETMKNLYKQHRRWGWGSENIPYMLEGFRKDGSIPRRKKWYWSFISIEGFHSWATNALMIFALGWLPLVLGGREFNDTLLSYSLPHVTRYIMTFSMIGIATSAVVGILLLPPRPEWFRPWHTFLYIVQWALMPITLIVFGALPGLEAQTRLALGGRWRLGFWVTPKHRAAASSTT